MKNKLLSLFFSVCILVTCFTGLSVTASADGETVTLTAGDGTGTITFTRSESNCTDSTNGADVPKGQFCTMNNVLFFKVPDCPAEFTAPTGFLFNGWKLGSSIVNPGGILEVTENATLTASWKPSAPTFSPVGGNYTVAQSVTISCEATDAYIYYTTDGNDPDENSDLYSAPIEVCETTTIKAAAKKGDVWSEIAAATYTITQDPYNLYNASVEVDTDTKSVSVTLNGETVSTEAYTVTYYTYEEIPGGGQLENAKSTFPTEPGDYIATIAAATGSDYTGSARSTPFTIEGEVSYDLSKATVTVNTSAKSVTVTLNGKTVPAEFYRVTYYIREGLTGTGWMLDIGSTFPTSAGTFKATITAAEGSDYTGSASSDPFTISEPHYPPYYNIPSYPQQPQPAASTSTDQTETKDDENKEENQKLQKVDNKDTVITEPTTELEYREKATITSNTVNEEGIETITWTKIKKAKHNGVFVEVNGKMVFLGSFSKGKTKLNLINGTDGNIYVQDGSKYIKYIYIEGAGFVKVGKVTQKEALKYADPDAETVKVEIKNLTVEEVSELKKGNKATVGKVKVGRVKTNKKGKISKFEATISIEIPKAEKYRVRYSVNKDMTNSKTTAVKKGKALPALKNTKPGDTCYMQYEALINNKWVVVSQQEVVVGENSSTKKANDKQ